MPFITCTIIKEIVSLTGFKYGDKIKTTSFTNVIHILRLFKIVDLIVNYNIVN